MAIAYGDGNYGDSVYGGLTPTQTSVARISLAPAIIPITQTNHSITIRGRVQTGTGTFRASLWQGTTQIDGDLETGSLTTSLATYTLALSDAAAATITSYANLEIRIWGYNAAGVANTFEVADVKLIIPAASNIRQATYTTRIIGSAVNTSQTIRAARITGKAVSASAYAVRVIGAGIGTSAYAARITGRASLNTTYASRITGSFRSSSATQATRITGRSERQTNETRVALQPIQPPGISSGVILRVRAHKANLTDAGILRVTFYEGSTARDSYDISLTDTFVTDEHVVSDVIVASIVDWGNLRVGLQGIATGGSTLTPQVSWIELEAPVGQATVVPAWPHSVRITSVPGLATNYAARVTGSAIAFNASPTRITGRLGLSAAYTARVTGQSILAIPYGTRLTGQSISNIVYSARVTGQFSLNTSYALRITGTTSLSTTRPARITGQGIIVLAEAIRITGQITTSRVHTVRITGQNTLTTTYASRITGQATLVRIQSSRITGKSLVSVSFASRITGRVGETAVYGVRIKGQHQIARPASDISTGSWSTSPLWSNLNENQPDDTTQVTVGSDSTFEVKFTPLFLPQVGTHYVRYRIGKNADAGVINFTVGLYCGATLIAEWIHNDVASGFVTVEQILTTVQISAITDYTDLRLRFAVAIT